MPTWIRDKLYVQVLIAVLGGVALGCVDANLAVSLKPLGDAFIKLIRAIIAPIIFTTIAVGLARMGDMRKIARIGLKALVYFEVASTLAIVIGLVVGNLWPIGRGINASAATLDAGAVSAYIADARSLTIVDFLLDIIPATFIDPFVRGQMLPVLLVAVLFGLSLCAMGKSAEPLVALIDRVSQVLFGMVGLIMRFAPLGAFGAMAFTVGKYGARSLLELGELVLAVYVVSATFVILVLGGALRLAGFGLLKVVSHFKDEILFVFAATSAETMIPRSMEKLEQLGCEKDVVGLVMPAGFSFNMDGTAIYMTMAVLFMAHATHTELTLAQQLVMLFVMLFTSKGAAGVTGGGFVALAATLPAIGVLPIGALTLLIGVDRFMARSVPRPILRATSSRRLSSAVGRARSTSSRPGRSCMANRRPRPDLRATWLRRRRSQRRPHRILNSGRSTHGRHRHPLPCRAPLLHCRCAPRRARR
jgi:aerobic C4-dicarboxylate transport protein